MERITDLTFLTAFTGGNSEKMKKYIRMFVTSCPEQLLKMKELLESGNYDGLKAVAHGLKPQITYMGIKAGEAPINQIEEYSASKTNLQQLPGLVDEFNNHCKLAIDELSKELA